MRDQDEEKIRENEFLLKAYRDWIKLTEADLQPSLEVVAAGVIKN